VPKNPLEVLEGRLVEESHARRVVQADGTVEVAPVRDVYGDKVRRVVLPAVKAIEMANAFWEAGLQIAFAFVAARICGDERLGWAAGRALLHQKNGIAALGVDRGDKRAAGIAQSEIHVHSTTQM